MISGYLVKKPRKHRKSFSIIPYQRVNGVRKYQSPIEDPALASLNANYLKGVISLEEAELQLRTVILPRLKQIIKIKAVGDARLAEHNRKVFAEFWKSEYEGKKIVRPKIAYNDFIAALEGLGSVSVMVATKDEIQKAIDSAFTDNNQNNRYGSKINQILKYLGREFSIYVARRDTPVVQYLTWTDLQTLLQHIPEQEIKDLAMVLFGLGVRYGEAFVLTERDLRPNLSVYIHRQLTVDMKITPIKNRKPHLAALLKECKDSYLRWARVSDKPRLRNIAQKRIIDCARLAFPNDSSRHVSPHDLRHSYVIHMLGLGVPLDKIARLIGDTLATTELHYAGFVMSDNELDFVLKIINK